MGLNVTNITTKKLTQARVFKLLRYDEKIGDLFWREEHIRNGVIYGRVTGCLSLDGYRRTRIDREIHLNHRLIWLYHYGYDSENDIDHIDRNKVNNRVENLREVSRSCNIRNSVNRKDNKSGVKGVTFCNDTHKWRAHIQINKKRYHLGLFRTKEGAVKARYEKECAFNWASCNDKTSAQEYLETQNEEVQT